MASKWMLVVLILCGLSLEIQATKSSEKKASDSSSTKPEIKAQRTSRLDLAPSESRSEFLKSDNNKFANHQLDEYELKHRRNHIKGSMLHAWNGYKKYAGFAHDELRPITKTHYDWMNMSVSLFSSLDTLYIMNLTKEFQEAREWIRTNTTHFFHRDLNVSLFETTIRVLGGLLGAYQVSHDQLFVDKAEELAGVLLYAFENPSCKALPCPSINLKTHKGYATWGSHVTTLAEIGSLQLEFNYLSYLLNDTTYKNAADGVIRHLDKLDPPMGLYPLLYELRSGNIAASVGNAVTIGASADSFYEYLLKQWIQSNHTSHDVKKLYEESIDGILGILPRRSHPSEDLYIGYVVDKELVPRMDHLSCFFPGLLALGAHGSTEKRDLDFAEELLQTCFDMYACQFTGLAPEVVEFAKGVDFRAVDAHYYLRPETVESIFILHRKTGNPKYREWGWFIYQKLLQWCKTDAGFAGVIDVRNGTEKDDRMQAFFLSETLKYLYLLMCDDDILPLSKFVFNTEAHPMPILHYR